MRSSLLVVAVVLAGCYNPDYRDCEVSCASGACPSGLSCESGVCRVGGATGECSVLPPDAPGETGVPLDMLQAKELTAICGYFVRCGVFETQAICESVFGRDFNSLADQMAAIANGTVVYHPDKAAECIASFSTTTCERAFLFSNRLGSQACNDIFTGTVDANGACSISEQCVSQVCTAPACSMACCPGTCTGARAPGPRAVGDSCTFRDRCTTSYCDRVTSACAPYKGMGDACTQADECADGFGCRFDATGGQGTCQPLSGVNGVCSSAQDCKDLSNVCSAGKCRVGGLNGSPCQNNTECQLDHACDGGPNGCGPLPDIGESCQLTGQCQTGYCAQMPPQSVCTPYKVDGAVCNPQLGGTECASRYCETSGGTSACKPRPVCAG